MTHAQPSQPSPLQQQMTRITRLITVLAVGMGLVFFAVGWGLGRLTPMQGFVFALGIIVANVPEERIGLRHSRSPQVLRNEDLEKVNTSPLPGG